MSPEIAIVKKYYEQPHRYLRQDFDIDVRSLIVRRILGTLEYSNILDVGAGDGRISLQFLSVTNHVTLVDISASMLSLAQANACVAGANFDCVTFINDDFCRQRWNEQFDIVICMGVLAHVESVTEAIEGLAQACKRGGRCIVQFTDVDVLLGRVLHSYGRLRSALPGAHGYATNATSGKNILEIARTNGLKADFRQRYSGRWPGMKYFPNEWLYQFELFTLMNQFVSQFCSDTILSFTKVND